jgi:hypothetical protein
MLWGAIRPIVIFAPLVIAVVWLVRFNNGSSGALLSFNQIHGNTYIVSDVLLAFIVASYVIVFLGLCFYFWGVINDLNKYAGDSSWIKFLNAFSLILLLTVFVALSFYLFAMYAICKGWVSQNVHETLNIEIIVWLNKLLSFGIFSIFLLADLLVFISHTLQQKEITKLLDSSPNDIHLQSSKAQNSDQIHLSKSATFLVNIPTVFLTGSMLILTSYLSNADRFRGAVDHHLHFMEIQHVVKPEIFQLFLNGFEAGVIVCTIIYSQIVYVIIRTKWGPK